jgi:predicted enzyme related to lactoylglutathione lyase
MPVPNHVSHFAIHADDLARAKRFYQAVFGWKFEAWGPPDFYMIKTTTGTDPGMFGSLQKRDVPLAGTTAMRGFECTIAVASVDETSRAVEKAGGTIVMKRMTIGTVGHLVKFLDTEGNKLGAMEYDEHACSSDHAAAPPRLPPLRCVGR